MSSLLNLLKHKSGCSQLYTDYLLSLLRGKRLKIQLALIQQMQNKIQILSQNRKQHLTPEKSEVAVFTEKEEIASSLFFEYVWLFIIFDNTDNITRGS